MLTYITFDAVVEILHFCDADAFAFTAGNSPNQVTSYLVSELVQAA